MAAVIALILFWIVLTSPTILGCISAYLQARRAIKTLICRSPSCKGECGGMYESEE